MNSTQWYSQNKKPKWAPPGWLFGPVWSVLYILIIVSFGFVFSKLFRGDIGFIIVLPFVLNIVFNIIFTPIQFGLRNNVLASIDILLVLSTLVWLMVVIYPYYTWISYIQIPYLLWVSFASVLQIEVMRRN
ncbi:MAG: TspO/MBR family protein [Candidatus Dojkabacteria bacterium]|jgi:tryptophan-rich sensory protein|nr:TspO/MBR family protein [Candidatus Dojkabacteria bacterium]